MANAFVRCFDFSMGVVNARENPLAYPANALTGGENVEINDKSLRTRQGFTMECTELAGGVIEELRQVRLATTGASYLIAQVRVGGDTPSCKLYASPTQLPTDPVFGTAIYDLGTTAGTVSIATLNDRVIITEGTAKAPIVFSGCLSATGSDWTFPKNIILTLDNANFYDGTLDLCDTDTDTTVGLGSWPVAGYLYICCDQPITSGLYFGVGTANTTASTTMVVERFTGGAWTAITKTDNTAAGGISLAQSGTVTWTAVSTEYKLIQGLSGYWLRVSFDEILSANATLAKITYQAPCQLLQSIGPAFPDNCMGFVYNDVSAGSIKEFTTEVSDASPYTYATLSDGNVSAPTGWSTTDAVYIGYTTPFNTLEITPENNHNNSAAVAGVTLTVKFWNGTAWAAVSGMTDNTIDNSRTFCKKGTITYTLPTAWKECKALDTFAMGYWVQLTVSASCYGYLMVSEAAIYPTPKILKKHSFATTIRDRVILGKRPDAPDQIDIASPLDPTLWTGPDSYALRVGGMDALAGLVSLYNQVWMGKADEWYMLNGYSPDTFASERAETSSQAPINARVCVPAPFSDGSSNKQGVYFLNDRGAWFFSGVQIIKISDRLTWFDPTSPNPRIDIDYLHLAFGAYNSEKNWVLWSVPLITGAGSSQTTCNYLIVYDVSLGAWLPPFNIALSSMCSVRLYNANAPGYIGQNAFYAGTTAGNIVRLFSGTTDNGVDIEAWITTGWQDFGAPEVEKQIRSLRMYGYCTDADSITLGVFSDGAQTIASDAYCEFSDLTGLSGKDWTPSQEKEFLAMGHFLKWYLAWTGPATVYGWQAEVPAIRDEDLHV